jgi:hypothetical protein
LKRTRALAAIRRFGSRAFVKLKPRNLRSAGRATALFCFVDLELEPPRDEAGDAPLHPLPCPLAAHVDVAVVRIPHEAVLAPLQFPIKFVEHEVRQQWR